MTADTASLGLALAVPLALLIDHVWGEPPVRLHPVVWMGKALSWAGERCAPPAARAHGQFDAKNLGIFCASALYWCALAAIVVACAWLLQLACLLLPPWAAVLGLAVCLKPLLAWRMLRT